MRMQCVYAFLFAFVIRVKKNVVVLIKLYMLRTGDYMENNNKGFTLAELLIVVAIVGVLVAISIPIFSGKRVKAKIATNQANYRSAKAAAVVDYMTAGSNGKWTKKKGCYFVYDVENGSLKYDKYADIAFGQGNGDEPIPYSSTKQFFYVNVNDDGVIVYPSMDFISDPKNYR